MLQKKHPPILQNSGDARKGSGDGTLPTCGMSPRLLPVKLDEQRVLGTFADAVHRLVDILDLSAFDAHYRNDTTGAMAQHPPPQHHREF